ncbi:MAG: TIGR02757 family protein [Muribaculaceae bacterium]|nr:TIGR02757 family protein [Muribaculaceae bacterium]
MSISKSQIMPDADTVSMLRQEAARINSPEFIDLDPVQFPRRFTRLQDIEIAAIVCSSISWGNRAMIRRSCDRMLALMGHDPYAYVMDGAYEDLPDGNIHRTFFAANLRHFLRGLHRVYSRYDSLNDFARAHKIGSEEAPAWALARVLNGEFAEANGGCGDNRCLPLNLETTALKRLNMALRWLVRNDGIVDLGVWDAITPAQLYIPLDVHVGNVARQLGLLTRKSNDRKAAVELTETLRLISPDDPTWLDYALFGIGAQL